MDILQHHGAIFNERYRHRVIDEMAQTIQSTGMCPTISMDAYSVGRSIGPYLQVGYHRLLVWSSTEAAWHITKRGHQSLSRQHLFRFGIEMFGWLSSEPTSTAYKIQHMLGTLPLDILCSLIIFNYQILVVHVQLSVETVLNRRRYVYRRRRSNKSQARLRQQRYRDRRRCESHQTSSPLLIV